MPLPDTTTRDRVVSAWALRVVVDELEWIMGRANEDSQTPLSPDELARLRRSAPLLSTMRR